MKKAYLSVIVVFFSALMFAQEGTGTKIDVDINKDSAAWYASPWVWVVGAAVFKFNDKLKKMCQLLIKT